MAEIRFGTKSKTDVTLIELSIVAVIVGLLDRKGQQHGTKVSGCALYLQF